MEKLKSKVYELADKGQFNKAEAKLVNFIAYLNKIDSNDDIITDYYIDAFNLISDLYIFLGKFEELYSCFDKTIYNNPHLHDVTKADFFIKIGILLYTQGKYSDSENFFLKTLEIMEICKEYFSEEDKLIIYRFIAEIYKKTSRFEDSELFYNKANPKPIVIKTAHYSKSEYSYYLKNYELGISDLYILQNRLSEAESILKNSKYIESDESIIFSLSDLYLKQGKLKQSEELLEYLINNTTDLSLYLIAAADCLTIRGLYKDAIYFFNRASEINPKIRNSFIFKKRYISLYKQQKSNLQIPKYKKKGLDITGVYKIWDYIIPIYELKFIFDGFCTYNSLYSGLNRCADLMISGKCRTNDYFYSRDFYWSIPPLNISITPFFTTTTKDYRINSILTEPPSSYIK